MPETTPKTISHENSENKFQSSEKLFKHRKHFIISFISLALSSVSYELQNLISTFSTKVLSASLDRTCDGFPLNLSSYNEQQNSSGTYPGSVLQTIETLSHTFFNYCSFSTSFWNEICENILNKPNSCGSFSLEYFDIILGFLNGADGSAKLYLFRKNLPVQRSETIYQPL